MRSRSEGIVVAGTWDSVWRTISWYVSCIYPPLELCIPISVQGSGFIAYGTIMAILLLVGEGWVRRSGRSPDWWDSWVIMLWVRVTPHILLQSRSLSDYNLL